MPSPSLYIGALHSYSIPARGIAHGRKAMAVQKDTATIYRSVIDEVVTRIKPDFVQEGVDECASESLEWTRKNDTVVGRPWAEAPSCAHAGPSWTSSALCGRPSCSRAAP